MIVNIRGASGSGKSTTIKTLLDVFKASRSSHPHGHLIGAINTVVLGEYYRANHDYRWEAQLDHLPVDQIETIVREQHHNGRNVIFECGRVSSSFARWHGLASDVGFHEMMFVCIDANIEKCLARRRARKQEHGTLRENTTESETHLRKTHEDELKSRAKLLRANHQVYVVPSAEHGAQLISWMLRDIDDDELVSEALRLSGGGKRSGSRRWGLYTSIPGCGAPLDSLESVRDSSKRLDDFGLTSEVLTGRSVIELGSNVGGLSFELVRRGAAELLGVEYNYERVAFCNKLAQRSGMTNVRFISADLRDTSKLEIAPADLVVCCSVDEYIENRLAFYSFMRRLTAGTCYFESDAQNQTRAQTEQMLRDAGFAEVTFVGGGDGGLHTRKRNCFVCV